MWCLSLSLRIQIVVLTSGRLGQVLFLNMRPLIALFMSNGCTFSGSNSLSFNDWVVTYWAENAALLLYSYKKSMSYYIVVDGHVSHFSFGFSL